MVWTLTPTPLAASASDIFSKHPDARKAVEARMKGLAEGLGRDPQVESILRGKRQELGLDAAHVAGRSVGDDLARSPVGGSQGLER